MKNPHKGVHKSYGVHWTDILELNDAEEMAKRSAILIGLICSGFMGAASWTLFYLETSWLLNKLWTVRASF